jgi:hypothetical protein
MMRSLVLRLFVAAVSHLLIGFAFLVGPMWVQWHKKHHRCRMRHGRPTPKLIRQLRTLRLSPINKATI